MKDIGMGTPDLVIIIIYIREIFKQLFLNLKIVIMKWQQELAQSGLAESAFSEKIKKQIS